MMANRIELEGKVVVVTGASGGIGEATTRELVRRGAKVAMFDLSEEQGREKADSIGDDVRFYSVDVTDRSSLDAAVAQVREDFGRIDVVFANAGISAGNTTYTVNNTPEGVYEKIMKVNVDGVWNTVKATLPDVLETKGHFLLTSSFYATVNGVVNAPYAASKAAVEALSRSMRVELAHLGVTVATLYPGWIKTNMAAVSHGADELSTALNDRAMPAMFRDSVPAEFIARRIVEGIEARYPRLNTPRTWKLYFAFQGIINPIADAWAVRDSKTQELVAKIERRSAEAVEKLKAKKNS